MTAKTFTFHTDPGHGWLEVDAADLAGTGLARSSFSAYSYVFRGKLYLEEDCDAPLFINAYKAKHGPDSFRSVEQYADPSPIRNYPSNNPINRWS
ncbi:hypothetical protein [Erythrobacter phage vB_EliS-L02]|nr:hypothetical protein [Erythrobacter phage vB_EliS-L02]